MTSNKNLILCYESFAHPKSVKITNRLFIQVIEKGVVKLADGVLLYDMLHVPCLSFNLILIGNITQDNNCFGWFSSSKCCF